MGNDLDSGIPSDRPSMRAREIRTSLDAEVSLRRSGQHHYKVRIYNASPHGCRIEFVERPSLDEHVWVRFEGLEAIEGQVCWVDGFVTGVEFVKPIHPAVFDRLVGGKP
ncbi:MAG TPA: PilZ domain-containing protein [Sphingomicrobium sp.]|nr:PilZ domain-containing protein [Sphingomicrobium sp.]